MPQLGNEKTPIIMTKRKNYDILPEDFEGEDYTVWFW